MHTTDTIINVKIKKKISTKKIITGYYNAFNIDVSKYFKKHDYIFLCECKSTGYYFFLPSDITGDATFYEALQKFEWYYQKDKWEFNVTKPLLIEGNLLEIGCGTGDFLYSIQSNKNLKSEGIDFNTKAIEECKKKGLEVKNKDLKEFSLDAFDYIVAFQVLEHISSVNEFFDQCNKILKKKGNLIIGVPNTNSFVFKPFSNYYFTHGSLLLNLPPHHIGWWTKKSLQKMGALNGFKLIQSYYEPLPKFREDLVSQNLKIFIKNKYFYKIIEKCCLRAYNRIFKGETIVVVLQKI